MYIIKAKGPQKIWQMEKPQLHLSSALHNLWVLTALSPFFFCAVTKMYNDFFSMFVSFTFYHREHARLLLRPLKYHILWAFRNLTIFSPCGRGITIWCLSHESVSFVLSVGEWTQVLVRLRQVPLWSCIPTSTYYNLDVCICKIHILDKLLKIHKGLNA